MTDTINTTPRADYSILLRVVAGFLLFGAATVVPAMFSGVAKSLGWFYQVALVISGVISAVAAIGLWQHKKWGAWTYIGLTIFNQPFLYFMGWWVAGALVIPVVLVALILLKFKWLN